MLNLYDIFEELLEEHLLTEGVPKGRPAKRKPIKSGSKNIYEILKNHIEMSMTCKIYYNGENTKNKGWRTIEPYALGTHKGKKGNTVLRARQLSRTASDTPNGTMKTYKDGTEKIDPLTPLPNGWRMFRVDQITDVKSGGKKFRASARSEYNPFDKDMKPGKMNLTSVANDKSWTSDNKVPREDEEIAPDENEREDGYEAGSGKLNNINTFGVKNK